MAVRSNNNVADDILASAQENAAHDGLRLAVPRYLEAVDALAAEDRKPEARGVLAQLLSAKEKRRGFLFTKREQSALGDQRLAVATKYAAFARGEAPTEESLDILNQLALEFQDDVDIRMANAEALANAGYLLDALDEHTFCSSRRPDDEELKAAIASLYRKLGRGADAAAAYENMSGDALKAHRSDIAALVDLVAETRFDDPSARAAVVERLRAVSDKLLAADPADRSIADRVDALGAEPEPAQPEPAQPEPAQTQAQAAQPEAAPPVAPPAPAQPVSAAPPAVEPQAAIPSSPSPDTAASPSAPQPQPKRPTAGGLSAFAKRKALELFANSEYEAASTQLERVVKIAPDVEALELLLECSLVLERHAEAARTGVQLADAELAAGNRPGAIATLTTLSKKIADPAVEQRRVELMKTN